MNQWYDNLRKLWRFMMMIAIVIGALLIGKLLHLNENLVLIGLLGVVILVILVRLAPKPSRMIRVKIEDADFAALVRGEVAKLKTVDGRPVIIILADIGFDRMLNHINYAAVK